ncbi:hypothetical protein HPB50_018231 [Hyalomma asiaticum]|uniref:Uncharacterized protein n=1 Tax=Hyalomma asiaticum TaxID=266040 RepID=A0ACB7SP83_HYAAI|nr:hypothetical protein HPB50_018231 [Hyalomma asiaticum]
MERRSPPEGAGMLEEKADSASEATVGVGWTTGHSPKSPAAIVGDSVGHEASRVRKAKHHPSASAVRVRLCLVRRCRSVLFNVWPLLLLLLP